MSEQKQFSKDDKVTWTKVKTHGQTTRMTTMEGKVLYCPRENVVLVKMKNGREIEMHQDHLRKAGEQTELTEAFMSAFSDDQATQG